DAPESGRKAARAVARSARGPLRAAEGLVETVVEFVPGDDEAGPPVRRSRRPGGRASKAAASII
ncbi:MAG: hypothetical protein ABW026_12215, partial [Microvirga sp.]